jgi:hypothetical protein
VRLSRSLAWFPLEEAHMKLQILGPRGGFVGDIDLRRGSAAARRVACRGTHTRGQADGHYPDCTQCRVQFRDLPPQHRGQADTLLPGALVLAFDEADHSYEAVIMLIAPTWPHTTSQCLVHFCGSSHAFNEWIPADSWRIVPRQPAACVHPTEFLQMLDQLVSEHPEAFRPGVSF